ncbi:hypothetical protein BH09ACT12_BH09ACT12_28210 [soil metagenome]
MTTPRAPRARRALVALSTLLLGGLLAGCSSDDTDTDDEAASHAATVEVCRAVAVADASLTGTRRQFSRGNIDNQIVASYATAIALLAEPATDPRISAELATDVTRVIETIDLSRSLIVQVSAVGVETQTLTSAATHEVDAVQSVAKICADEVPEDVVSSPSESD